MKRASKETLAGRHYVDLQREAKRTGRPTDELIQLYALECFLDRLVHSEFADTFILKGGILLAGLDARRPIRDIDFAVCVFENSAEKALSAVRTIAAISLDDGMTFDSSDLLARRPSKGSAFSFVHGTFYFAPCAAFTVGNNHPRETCSGFAQSTSWPHRVRPRPRDGCPCPPSPPRMQGRRSPPRS